MLQDHHMQKLQTSEFDLIMYLSRIVAINLWSVRNAFMIPIEHVSSVIKRRIRKRNRASEYFGQLEQTAKEELESIFKTCLEACNYDFPLTNLKRKSFIFRSVTFRYLRVQKFNFLNKTAAFCV